MNEKEMRELDVWIAEHVMGWRSGRSGLQSKNDPVDDAWILQSRRYETIFKCAWQPTVRPEDAMSVLKKCAEKSVQEIAISQRGPKIWTCGWIDFGWESLRDEVEAPTVELAICLFAKELFSKHAKETQA